MELDMKRMGERLRAIRDARNQSRLAFAELCGISDRYLADIERGDKAPKLETFVRMVNAIGVSSEYLLQDSLTAPNKTNLTAYALEKLPPEQQQLFQEFILQMVEAMGHR